MTPKRTEKGASSCCDVPGTGRTSCCRVEAILAIDSRGQVVLPKEVRERAGIAPGDKLALITWEAGGEICCLSLVKAEEFAESVKQALGPMLSGIIG